jgi:hypothetical protein
MEENNLTTPTEREYSPMFPSILRSDNKNIMEIEEDDEYSPVLTVKPQTRRKKSVSSLYLDTQL